jgi:Iap family predicted aminopeptidase
MPAYNRKFVQKWLTVVQLRFFVNYLVQCGATLVLQAMPFLHKLAKRWQKFWNRKMNL